MGSDGATFTASLLNPASNLNAIILLVGVITVLFYFFFSIEHSGPVHLAARTGIIFLMISLVRRSGTPLWRACRC